MFAKLESEQKRSPCFDRSLSTSNSRPASGRTTPEDFLERQTFKESLALQKSQSEDKNSGSKTSGSLHPGKKPPLPSKPKSLLQENSKYLDAQEIRVVVKLPRRDTLDRAESVSESFCSIRADSEEIGGVTRRIFGSLECAKASSRDEAQGTHSILGSVENRVRGINAVRVGSL